MMTLVLSVENQMKIMKIGMLLSAAMIVGTASGVVAQTAEPSYRGDPGVYKVIFEDANFRSWSSTG